MRVVAPVLLRFLLRLLTAAVVVFTTLQLPSDVSARGGGSSALFDEQPGPSKLTVGPSRSQRHRFVRFDATRISGIRSRFHRSGYDPNIDLNLFSDVGGRLIVDRPEFRRDGGVVLTGSMRGYSGSSVILAYREGTLSGRIDVPGVGMYLVQPAGDGLHEITEALPPEGMRADDVVPQPLAGMAQEGFPFMVPLNFPIGCTVGASPTVIDVMILYTPAALTQAGGLIAIRNVMDIDVASINRSFFVSGVNAEVRLVHAEQVAYVESGDLTTDVTRLQDGTITGVQTLRNTYGADLVCMLTGTPNPMGGQAFEAVVNGVGIPSIGYSAMRYDASMKLVFDHELGHNLGCNHDAGNVVGGSAYPYSRGWRFTAMGKQYKTIMSYDPGMWVPYYSSPLVNFMGVATGTATADNARTLNDTAPMVAGFRPTSSVNALPDVAVGIPIDGTVYTTPVSVAVAVSASDSDGSVVQVDYYMDNVYYGTTTAPPHVFNVELVPSGHHFIQAHAIDDAGGMSLSCPVSIEVISSLPDPWTDQDVGPTGFGGSGGYVAGVYTVSGSGVGFSPGTGSLAEVDSVQFTSTNPTRMGLRD